jgi:hypothetical protein
MNRSALWLASIALLFAPACTRRAPSSQSGSAPAAAPTAASKTPPYRPNEEAAKPYPKLLAAERFADRPVVARAYRIAAAIPAVVAQQPCYCGCEAIGHGSLLDCWVSDHGAG